MHPPAPVIKRRRSNELIVFGVNPQSINIFIVFLFSISKIAAYPSNDPIVTN